MALDRRDGNRGSAPSLPSAFFASFATRVLDEARFATRPEFRYLSTEHAPHYRRILRCFLEAYESYYQDELTAEWVFQALSQWDPDYTLDRCRDDLDSLCEWGNLAKSLDI